VPRSEIATAFVAGTAMMASALLGARALSMANYGG
jgi:hypothetical protein